MWQPRHFIQGIRESLIFNTVCGMILLPLTFQFANGQDPVMDIPDVDVELSARVDREFQIGEESYRAPDGTMIFFHSIAASEDTRVTLLCPESYFVDWASINPRGGDRAWWLEAYFLMWNGEWFDGRGWQYFFLIDDEVGDPRSRPFVNLQLACRGFNLGVNSSDEQEVAVQSTGRYAIVPYAGSRAYVWRMDTANGAVSICTASTNPTPINCGPWLHAR